MLYTIKGTPQLPETQAIIDYLLHNYPLPVPVDFIFMDVEDFQIGEFPRCNGGHCTIKGRAQIEVADKIIPGKKGRNAVIHTLLHEYRHAIQEHVQGLKYNFPRDIPLEMDANKFGWEELEKLKKRKVI